MENYLHAKFWSRAMWIVWILIAFWAMGTIQAKLPQALPYMPHQSTEVQSDGALEVQVDWNVESE